MSEYVGKGFRCLFPKPHSPNGESSCIYMGWTQGDVCVCLAKPDKGCPEHRASYGKEYCDCSKNDLRSQPVILSAMKLAIIEWVDSNMLSGWGDFSDCDLCKITSVGIVKETSQCYQVIGNYDFAKGHGNGVMAIPKCAVTRIRYLKVEP